MTLAKHFYETTFIVNASLEDSQIESAISHVQEIITRNGGEITAINRWGRKRLAYAIQKKNNGFFVNLEFTAQGTLISQLERAYLLDENILRFLTIQLDKHALKARQQASFAAAAAAAAEAEAIRLAPPAEVKEPLFADDETAKSPKAS